MNIFASTGVAVGLMVGIILAVLLLKFANRNHSFKTEYDERQREIRGKAYRYAFYTIIIFELLMVVLRYGDIELPVRDYIFHATAIMVGCTVLCCYCIWHDVYWGLNNNPKRYYIVFAVCGLLNLVPIIGSLRNGSILTDGKLDFPFINLLVLLMIAIALIEFWIKHILDKREAVREDGE